MTLRFARLTRPAIRQLEPGQSIGEHGIVAERLASGDVRFSVNVMVDGRRVHRAIGMASAGVTRFQAEQFLEKTRTDARADRLQLPKGRKLFRTFDRAAIEYIERMQQSGGRNMGPKR